MMRATPDWGTGPPTAHIEERKLLRYRRVVVPANRVQWYKALFGREGVFRPRRSFPDAEVISDKGRRTVVRFSELTRPLATGGNSSVGDSPTGNGAFRTKEGAAKGGLMLKEERYPFPTVLHGLLTVPRAEREFHNLLALRSLQFPAVEPLACGHSGLWIFYHRSFLITREFSGAINLKAWMKLRRKGKKLDISPQEIEAALLGFARDLARLHKARCYVRTLYGKNILARRGADGRIELALCDVPRLWWFRDRALSFGLAAGDLACLDRWGREVLGPRSRLKLLKAYLERLGEGRPLRSWVRRILRQRDRMRDRTRLGRLNRNVRRWLRRYHLENYWPF